MFITPPGWLLNGVGFPLVPPVGPQPLAMGLFFAAVVGCCVVGIACAQWRLQRRPTRGAPATGVLRYRKFLAARDGEADLLRHTLSRREVFFDSLARTPVRSLVHIDRDTYQRNLFRRRPER